MVIQGHDLDESIERAMECLGKAAGANRVYIFRNVDVPDEGMPLMSQCYGWTDGLFPSYRGAPSLQNFSYDKRLPRWFGILSQGRVISGAVSDFPVQEHSFLESLRIKSILIAPIFIEQHFLGISGV